MDETQPLVVYPIIACTATIGYSYQSLSFIIMIPKYFKVAFAATAFLPLSAAFSLSHPLPHPVRTRIAQRKSFSVLSTTTSPDIEDPPVSDNDKPIVEAFSVGIRRDFSRRLPHYYSDLTDGLNAQSLATTLYLFFACLAPAIGFGGILGTVTNGAMGAIEMTVSTAFCGVIYALTAPQPAQLIGPMGPNLAFTISLAQLAKSASLPFLPFYAWTGLWTAGMLMVASLTSASHIVKYLSRFTDEIFSVLISAIFLFEAVSNVAKIFTEPLTTATKALLALTCASVTFGSGMALRGLKNSIYFTKSIRNNVSNFAPAIGVVLGSLVARAMRLNFAGCNLSSLVLPTKFVTTTGRPWLIPMTDLPVWARWGACLPAAFLAVLLFLDQNITARLVNNPRYMMKKGRDKDSVLDGMHGDLFVISILTGLCSIVGLPWMAGATTRSAAHVRSLSIFDDDGNITGTIENRVTGASIHALIGACVFFSWPRKLLSEVPLPVLSGVFMYLGLTSLQGLELWERVVGLFQDSSVAPKTRWSSVPNKTTTIFTLVQVFCVAAMMWVTKSPFGVMSPVMVAFLPLLRKLLVKIKVVDPKSLGMLDA
mmetsp:Transcript_15226/g.28906  ORF Transcript_15226/g.28906 Transcript_15226/m.28906 type:complete len:595 (+) Transcript_15226:32-1816(+)